MTESKRRPVDLRSRFESEALPHLDCVLRFALGLTGGNRSRAEDLTQEAFLKAYRGYDSFQAGTNMRAWLLTILRHLQIDQHRKNGVRPGLVPLQSVPDEELSETDGPTEPTSFDHEQFDQEVVRELDELGPEFRQALVLCDVEGMSYREIAEVMGCPVGTVRSRISRARAILRDRLQAHAVRVGVIRMPQRQR